MFYLGYHLHWGYGEVMALDTVERRHFVRLVSEEIERQNAAFEDARRGR